MKFNQTKLIKICDQVIHWSILVTLFLVPIYFAFWQENFNIFELNKLVIFKSALSLVVLATLVKIVLESKITTKLNLQVLIALLALLVYISINTLLALDPAQSFFGNYMRQQGILNFIYYWLWFLLLIFHLRTDKQIKQSLLAILGGLVLVLTYSFIQKFGFDWLSWSEPGTGRTFASLGQPNFLAYYFDLTIFLTLLCLVFFTQLWQKLVIYLLVCLQLCALSFTASRGGLIGLLAALLILSSLHFWQEGKRKKLFVIVGLTLALILSAHFFITTLVDKKLLTNPSLIRYASSFRVVSGSSQVRLFYWQAAWSNFNSTSWSRRLLGYGKDSQRFIFVNYYEPQWGLHEKLNSYPDRAHNLLIDIWLEFGLLGLALFAYFNLLIIIKSFKFWLVNKESSARTKLIPYLLAAASAYFFSNLFGFPLTTHYLCYYFILALLFICSTDHEQTINITFSKLFSWLVATTLTLFGTFFLWQFTYKYFIADIYFMKAKVAEARVDCQGVLANVDKASKWQPLNIYYQEKFLFMYNNCLPLSERPVQKQAMARLLDHLALISEPEADYDLLLNMAHSYSLFGSYLDKKYYLEAERLYQKLIKLNPYILSAYQDYGRMKIWSGDYEEAKTILHQGLEHSPRQLANYDQFGYQRLIDSRTYYLWELIADCDYHQKNFKAALAIYLDIESQNLVSVELYKSIADSYYQLKDYSQAELYLRKNLAIVPADFNVNLSLATLYAELANISEARHFAEAASLINPNNKEVIALLAKLQNLKK